MIFDETKWLACGYKDSRFNPLCFRPSAQTRSSTIAGPIKIQRPQEDRIMEVFRPLGSVQVEKPKPKKYDMTKFIWGDMSEKI